MKAKKIIPLVILTLVILVLTGVGVFSFYAREKDNNLKGTKIQQESTKKTESKEKETNEQKNTNDTSNDESQKANDNEKQGTKKVDSETKQVYSESNSSNQEDNKKVTINNNESKNSSNEVIQSSPKVSDESSNNDTTPWGALGISEYDYYHKPANKNITSYYKTTTECEAEGSKLDHYMCMQVNSYSGDIVGYMLIY